MLTFLTFLWRPAPGYRSAFGPSHVNALRRMVERHYQRPHRFVLVTDQPFAGYDRGIDVYNLWPDFARIPNPSGRKNPSCYRRLRVFSRNAGHWLGDRFVCLDLDCVITGDLEPLFAGDEDFRIWKSSTQGNPYNGSMFMLRAGARPQVWEGFDPQDSPAATKRAGLFGSDQAWIAHCLGPNEATWGPADGVYSFRNHLKAGADPLPANARVVFFHGAVDPWSHRGQRVPWVRENWG